MKIIMAHSFKGGSGKTILTSNLACVLATQGKKVLLIETDFSMPAFTSVFSQIEPDIFLNNYLSENKKDLSNYIYSHPSIDNLDLIFCDDVFDPSHKIFGRDQNWFQLKKLQLEQGIKKLDYDVIVFDTTPGMSLFVINLLLITDQVYLVMRSDTQSIKGTMILIDRIYKKTVDFGRNVDLNLVINQIPKVDQMQEVVEKVKQQFCYNYPFIKKVVKIEYEHQTSYLTSIDRFILPEGNPTFDQILTISRETNLL